MFVEVRLGLPLGVLTSSKPGRRSDNRLSPAVLPLSSPQPIPITITITIIFVIIIIIVAIIVIIIGVPLLLGVVVEPLVEIMSDEGNLAW